MTARTAPQPEAPPADPPADKPTDEPTDENVTPYIEPAKAKGPTVGDVIRTGENTYALIVGSETVKHLHEGNQRDRDGETEHPLIVDLPAPRRLELDPYTGE